MKELKSIKPNITYGDENKTNSLKAYKAEREISKALVSNKETGLNTDMDTTLIGVGVDYNITENTKVFGNLANKKVDTGATDSNTTYLGVGTEVRF